MTDREAIKLFEENMMYWGNEPLAKNVVAADRLAVSALQERIDRETGCKFCGVKLYFRTTQYTRPMLAPLTEAQALRDKLLDLTGEVYVEVDSVFCPMCGRKLTAIPGED